MYNLVCIDETWGNRRVVGRLTPVDTLADAKASICRNVELQVRSLRNRGIRPRVRSITRNDDYLVAVEWNINNNPADLSVAFIYAAELDKATA